MHHGHTPWIVILVKKMEAWKAAHGGSLPSFQERKDFQQRHVCMIGLFIVLSASPRWHACVRFLVLSVVVAFLASAVQVALVCFDLCTSTRVARTLRYMPACTVLVPGRADAPRRDYIYMLSAGFHSLYEVKRHRTPRNQYKLVADSYPFRCGSLITSHTSDLATFYFPHVSHASLLLCFVVWCVVR